MKQAWAILSKGWLAAGCKDKGPDLRLVAERFICPLCYMYRPSTLSLTLESGLSAIDLNTVDTLG